MHGPMVVLPQLLTQLMGDLRMLTEEITHGLRNRLRKHRTVFLDATQFNVNQPQQLVGRQGLHGQAPPFVGQPSCYAPKPILRAFWSKILRILFENFCQKIAPADRRALYEFPGLI